MKYYKTNNIITRDKVRANQDVLYIFGDNDIRRGYGGQAKEMRGEPNCLGISTKKLPTNETKGFKTDDEYTNNCRIILNDIHIIKIALLTGKYKAIVVPTIGVGLANLPDKAPKTYSFLTYSLEELKTFCEQLAPTCQI